MGKGKRYEAGEPKLNLKKVAAVLIVICVIIMAIIVAPKLFKGEKAKTETKTVANRYYAVYTNGKWGVINSKGETIIEPTYDETIIIPDSSKDVFLCTYDVDYNNNTYKSKVINSKSEEIITGYDKIIALENYDESNNLWYEKDVLLVSKEEKYGLVDMKGKSLLPCEYDKIETLKGVKSSILVKKDGKLGLVDNIGSVILDTNYEDIMPLSDKYENGYIVTNSDKKVGIMGYNKATILDFKYDEIKAIYGDNYYVAQEDGKWEIVDKEAKTYLKGEFDDVTEIHGENVVVIKNGKYGVTTVEGETKIKPEYQMLQYTYEDKYIFKKDNKYGIINLAGEELLKPEYSSLIYRSDAGFFEASKENEVNTTFIGSDLEIKLTGILSQIDVEKGYMQIRTDDTYNYYNFKFEQKSSKELLSTNTLFLDKKDGKYGYVNKEGIVVVDYIYDDAKEQNEFGYSSVKKNGMWGCIDSKGKEVITPAYKLENSSIIEFIGKWHRGEDLNLNYYTDK